jgi:hypothetical protein
VTSRALEFAVRSYGDVKRQPANGRSCPSCATYCHRHIAPHASDVSAPESFFFFFSHLTSCPQNEMQQTQGTQFWCVCGTCGQTVTCSRFCSNCAHSLMRECEDVLVNSGVARVLAQECLARAGGDVAVALKLVALAHAGSSRDSLASTPSAPASVSFSTSSAPALEVPSSSSPVVVTTPVSVNVNVEGASASAETRTRVGRERSPQEIEQRNKQFAVVSLVFLLLVIIGGVLTGVGFGTLIIGMAIAGIVLLALTCCAWPIWACVFWSSTSAVRI